DFTKNIDQARVLMLNFPLERMLGLYNPKIRRLGSVVCHALDVLIAYAATDSRPSPHHHVAATVDTGDDSQEYGDWTAFAEIYDEQMHEVPGGVSYLENDLRLPLSQFVSRCFAE